MTKNEDKWLKDGSLKVDEVKSRPYTCSRCKDQVQLGDTMYIMPSLKLYCSQCYKEQRVTKEL